MARNNEQALNGRSAHNYAKKNDGEEQGEILRKNIVNSPLLRSVCASVIYLNVANALVAEGRK